MNSQILMTHSEEQIALACRALRMSFETIQSLFGNREVKDISTSGKKGKTLRLEVRFENTTLTCMFNQDNVCNIVFLFFDNQNDICYYIDYCKQTFKYLKEIHSWINNDCYIWLFIERKVIGMGVSFSKPLSS